MDISIRNNDGETALDIAKRMGIKNIEYAITEFVQNQNQVEVSQVATHDRKEKTLIEPVEPSVLPVIFQLASKFSVTRADATNGSKTSAAEKMWWRIFMRV